MAMAPTTTTTVHFRMAGAPGRPAQPRRRGGGRRHARDQLQGHPGAGRVLRRPGGHRRPAGRGGKGAARWPCSATPCTTWPTRPHRRPAGRRLHPGPASRHPPLHLRLWPRRGSGRIASWAFIAASVGSAEHQAARRLLDPVEVRALGLVATAAVIGFAGNELVARYRIRVGREIGSAALVADGLHARTDGLTVGAAGGCRRGAGVPARGPAGGAAHHGCDPGRAA